MSSTEPTEPTESDESEAWERPIDKFRRTAVVRSWRQGCSGLRDVIEGRPKQEEPAIVSEAPAAPPPDNIEVILDFEHPERSVGLRTRTDRRGRAG